MKPEWKAPRQYALDKANGATRDEIVAAVRAEVFLREHCGEGCTGYGCTSCARLLEAGDDDSTG